MALSGASLLRKIGQVPPSQTLRLWLTLQGERSAPWVIRNETLISHYTSVYSHIYSHPLIYLPIPNSLSTAVPLQHILVFKISAYSLPSFLEFYEVISYAYHYIRILASLCLILLTKSVTTTCHLSFSSEWVNCGCKQRPISVGSHKGLFLVHSISPTWAGMSEAGEGICSMQLPRYSNRPSFQHFIAGICCLLGSPVTRRTVCGLKRHIFPAATTHHLEWLYPFYDNGNVLSSAQANDIAIGHLWLRK